MLAEQKKQVQEYALKAYEKKLVAGTSGNVSLRSDCGHIIITPTSFDYAAMTEQDIVVLTPEGTVIEGKHKPSSEWPMHCEIYRQLPEVRAIVHTHSPYGTAFAAANKEIPLILIEMVYTLLGEVRVAPLAMQGTAAVGVGAARALQGRGACLLQNHGVVAIGKDLRQAFLRAESVEEAAKISLMSYMLGSPALIPAEMAEEMLLISGLR